MALIDRQFELLQQELELVNTAIRQHDEITKSIKDWTIVTWTAAMGSTLAIPGLRPFVWLTGAIPLLFWIVDGSFRVIQRSFINRAREISEFANSAEFRSAISEGGSFDFPLLKMRTAASRRRDRLLGVMTFRTVG